MIVVVLGVSGSGKTVVGKALAARLGYAFVDGDDFHPPASVEKMRAGIPLDDDDRAPWLAKLRELIASANDLVLACSALKRSYRDTLRTGNVRFVYLDVDRAMLEQRLRERQHAFMPASLLDSQLATLEKPSTDEAKDTMWIDDTRPIDAVVEQIARSISR